MSKAIPYKLLIILGFQCFSAAYGIGVWDKTFGNLSPLKPDFVLLKMGIFSVTGTLKPAQTEQTFEKGCPPYRLEAWITHRLSKGETLGADSGKRLAEETQKLHGFKCFSGVEIDMEPLHSADPSTLAFLGALKQGLSKTSVRAAIVSDFPQADMEKILSVSDGLDWMLYDTGARSSNDYIGILVRAFVLAEKTLLANENKQILLGIPAYPDKTKLHDPKVENLKTVFQMLSQFKPQNVKPWCSRRLDFSVYAGWTLTQEEKAISQLIRAWRENLCKGS